MLFIQACWRLFLFCGFRNRIKLIIKQIFELIIIYFNHIIHSLLDITVVIIHMSSERCFALEGLITKLTSS